MPGKSNNSPRERRELFASEMKEKNIDLAIISNPKHIFYFSGFPSNLNMYLTLMKGPRSTSFLSIDNSGKATFLIAKGELVNPWVAKQSGKNGLELVFEGEISTYVDYDLNDRMITYADTLSSEFQKWWRKHSGVRRLGIEEWHLPDIFRSAVLSGGGGPELSEFPDDPSVDAQDKGQRRNREFTFGNQDDRLRLQDRAEKFEAWENGDGRLPEDEFSCL